MAERSTGASEGGGGQDVLDHAEVALLIQTMHDPSADVRVALFDALTRLPLAAGDWVEVAEYASWAIDAGDSRQERLAAIDAAPFVPVRSIREQVARLAESGEGEARAHAARAAALVGDPRAALALLGEVSTPGADDPTDPARHLAMIDVAAVADQVAEQCGRSPDDMVRFWLALALARAGNDSELRRLFDDVRLGLAKVWQSENLPPGKYPDGEYVAAVVRFPGPLLPPETVGWLQVVAEEKGQSAGLARWLVQATGQQPETETLEEASRLPPAGSGRWGAGFTEYAGPQLSAIREQISKVLRFDEQGLPSPQSLAAVQGQDTAPAAVTMLFEEAGRRALPIPLGNHIVGWVTGLEQSFRPHLEGLFVEYRRQAANGVVRALRWQIAWAVSRGGLQGLTTGLASHLRAADPMERIEAAHLIADAADYVTRPGGPLFGGGPAPERPVADRVLVEDIARATGGGQRAKPPEPAPPHPPAEPATAARPAAEPPPPEPPPAEAPVSAATSGAASPPPPPPEAPPPVVRAGARRATRSMRDIFTRKKEREVDVAAPPQAAPRWILAQAYDATDAVHPAPVERAFRANAPHLVQVQIGPVREDMRRATGGPSIDEVLPDRGPHELVLVFVPPAGNAVQAQALTLPATGPSEVRTFSFRTGPAGVDAQIQIAVLHENRVLQSAVLSGPVLEDPASPPPGAGVEFTLSVVRPGMADLENRQPFDAAVVVGHTPEGKQSAAGVSGPKVSRFDADRLSLAGASITKTLTDLADNPDAYGPGLDSPGSVELMRRLALRGAQLYGAMGKVIEQELAGEDLTRIQVLVSDPNDFLPLEFVYDLPSPSLEAGLCQNWRKALEVGRCEPSNHPTDGTGLAKVVCPLGFWALSKVIERQVVDRGSPLADLGGMDFAVRTEPTAERSHLSGFTSALFAASERVDSVRAGLSERVLSTLADITGRHAERAATWAEWSQKVGVLRPPLQVILSHTERVQSTLALEIGAGDLRAAGQFQGLVKPDPAVAPVVLLLGCDTAVADREFQSFVTEFRDAGAALVVGTIAAVLGEHAAPVAGALAVALHEASSGQGATTFGEVMRDIRRRLLAEGELMALCLTSFGDADWRLPG